MAMYDGLNASNPRLKRRSFFADESQGLGAAPVTARKPAKKKPGTRNVANTFGGVVRNKAINDYRNLTSQGTEAVNLLKRGAVDGLNLFGSVVNAGAKMKNDFTRGVAGKAPLPTSSRVFPKIVAQPPAPAQAADGGISTTPPVVKTPASIPSSSTLFHGSSPSGNPADVADLRRINPNGIPAKPRNTLVDKGVTLSDGSTLPYGAMVNGVPTFSDGTGGIPRTMTDAEIKGLGDKLNTAPASAWTGPQLAFNSPDSAANIAAIERSHQGHKFGITPEMNAEADLTAILNQDPRSTLGRAALNASRRAGAASTVLQRKADLSALGGAEDAAYRNYLATTQGQNRLDATNAAGQNALRRTNLGGLYDLAGIRARNEGQLANTDLAGQYGLAKPNASSAVNWSKLNSNALKMVPDILHVDANGQITDPKTGKLRFPTMAERVEALRQARAALMPQSADAQQSTSRAPYPDGTRLRSKSGALVVVRNGVPVDPKTGKQVAM